MIKVSTILLIYILCFLQAPTHAQCATVNPLPQPPTILDCGMAYAKLVPIILPGNTPLNALVYQWKAPQNAIISSPTNSTLQASSTGIYTLIVSDNTSTCVTSSTMEIVNGTLTCQVIASSTKLSPTIVNFTNISASTLGYTNIVCNWNFGNGQYSVTTAGNASTTTTYSTNGLYFVQIFASKGTCLDTFSVLVYPGLALQNFVGLEEQTLNEKTLDKKYFDLNGQEQELEKGKLLIELIGSKRRKIILIE